MSTKTVSTFVFWISRLPKGPKISSWTFFNCPFCVDFKNIRFFIIWSNLGRSFWKSTIFGHFGIKHLSLHELSASFMNTPEPQWLRLSTLEQSWTLMSTYEDCVMAPWVLISAHSNMVPFSWVLTRALGVMAPGSWVLKAANDCIWVLMSAQGYWWMSMSAHEWP